MAHDLTVPVSRCSRLDRDPRRGALAGGNTACLEGLRGRHPHHPRRGHRPAHARQRAHGRRPAHSTILLSHLHWDHVCGLPFFTPVYVPGHRVEIAERPERRAAARGRDPRDVPRAVLPGRLRRPGRPDHDARPARERPLHHRRHRHHDGAPQPPGSGVRLPARARRPVDRLRDGHRALRVRRSDAEEARGGR